MTKVTAVTSVSAPPHLVYKPVSQKDTANILCDPAMIWHFCWVMKHFLQRGRPLMIWGGAEEIEKKKFWRPFSRKKSPTQEPNSHTGVEPAHHVKTPPILDSAPPTYNPGSATDSAKMLNPCRITQNVCSVFKTNQIATCTFLLQTATDRFISLSAHIWSILWIEKYTTFITRSLSCHTLATMSVSCWKDI